ncbi:MAG TPA: adenylate/guanylate cyclase domain-containing protein [Dehalococcoidia bacterium]|nr:adenylate/guanylate cyclase domain-containing protein [Dehalococcoidia bacterium]
MDPRIAYTTTSDGLSIAYWSLGDGMPLVQMPAFPLSHVHLEWQIADARRWFEALSPRVQLIRYDPRGAGLSERNTSDFSTEAQIRDLEAVATQLGLDRFALFAAGDMAMTAIAYAAANPGRVSHLILWCGWARRADVSGSAQTGTLRALLDQDWEIYTNTVARVLLGWGAEEQASTFAAFFRECVTPEVLRTAIDAVYDVDVSNRLAEIQCPTLVLQPHEMKNPSVSVALGLAGRIKDAKAVMLEGASPLWFGEGINDVLGAIAEFLEVGTMRAVTTPAPEVSSSRTVLFTDIEGSTSLTERLGDAAARSLLRDHERIVREALRAHGGVEVKTMGDGFLASFASASEALESAIAIQRAFDDHNRSAAEPIMVRVGLNAGEPIADDRDLFGTTINEASRIMGLANGGEILVANVVRELAKGKGFAFADRGETVLRGFEEPVRIFEVSWRTQV